MQDSIFNRFNVYILLPGCHNFLIQLNWNLQLLCLLLRACCFIEICANMCLKRKRWNRNESSPNIFMHIKLHMRTDELSLVLFRLHAPAFRVWTFVRRSILVAQAYQAPWRFDREFEASRRAHDGDSAMKWSNITYTALGNNDNICVEITSTESVYRRAPRIRISWKSTYCSNGKFNSVACFTIAAGSCKRAQVTVFYERTQPSISIYISRKCSTVLHLPLIPYNSSPAHA